MIVNNVKMVQNSFNFNSNLRTSYPIFKQKENDENLDKNNTALKLALGVLLVPIIPIIDGDSFKETYKNKSFAKFSVGMAAIGGLFALSQFACKEKDDKQKLAINTLTGAVITPLMILVNNWANIKKEKTFAKKWYLLAALFGGATAFVVHKLNSKQ